jgi:hypothetical protein
MDELVRALSSALDLLNVHATRAPILLRGDGIPEGQVRASPGVLYFDETGSSGDSLYYKQHGLGTSGWIRLSGTALGTVFESPPLGTLSIVRLAPTVIVA